MPLVFEKDGFRFAFYSNDHKPIHVYVRKAGAEAIFDVDDEVELRESQGFKINDLNKAQRLAEENRDLIIKNGMNTLVDTAKKSGLCHAEPRDRDGKWCGAKLSSQR
jgi:hypothetical protein